MCILKEAKKVSCKLGFSKLCLHLLIISVIVLAVSSYAGIKLEKSRNSSGATALSYEIGEYQIKTVVADGKSYSLVTIDSVVSVLLEKGKPELPIVSTALMLYEMDCAKVTIDSIKYKTISSFPVLPSKGNLTRNIDPSTVKIIENKLYLEDLWYPENTVAIGESFKIRDISGVSIRVTPVSYNGARGEIRIAEKIYFSVVEKGSPLRSTQDDNLSSEFDRIYKSQFINYHLQHMRYTPVPDGDKMIIVTVGKYKEAAETLTEWKKQKGINVDIYLYPSETGGSGHAKLKNFIQGKYDSDKITYITLIGDWEDIPSKLMNYKGTHPASKDDDDVSSDPSYVYLSGNDVYADAFIGRISVKNLDQANMIVNKIITYEKKPEVGATWYKKAVSVGSSDKEPPVGKTDHWWLTNKINPLLLGCTYSSVETNYQGMGESTSDLSTSINDGRGLLNFMGHGNNNGFGFGGTSTFWYNISMINALNNGKKLPVVIPLACQFGTFKARTCAAEVWMRNSNGGAIVIMGSTPLMDWSPPQTAQVEMNRLVSNERHLSMGAYFYNGEMKMLDNGSGNKTMNTWIYFGDPSLQFFTDSPKELKLTHSDILSNNFEVKGLEETIVCLYSSAEDKMIVKTINNSGKTTFDASDFKNKKILITGTKRNYAPYIGEARNEGTAIDFKNNTIGKFGLVMISRTGMTFNIANKGGYRLSVYSIDGRRISTSSKNYETGIHAVSWKKLSLASGLYIVSLVGNSANLINKFLIR